MENYPVFRRAVLQFRVCTYVLLTRSPLTLAGSLDLHACIHVTSVHPELESNSQNKCSNRFNRNKRFKRLKRSRETADKAIKIDYIRDNFKKPIRAANCPALPSPLSV